MLTKSFTMHLTKYISASLLVVITIFLFGIAFQNEALAQSEKISLDPNEILVRGQKNSSKWIQAESQHFILYSDVKPEEISVLLNILERFDYLLRVYTDTEKKAEKQPKLVYYYFSSSNDLKKISSTQPEFAIGLYNSCASGVQAFAVHTRTPTERSDDLANIKNLNASISYIFEAYARHFLYHNTDIRTPTWFIDGFAQYFSTTRFTDSQVILGKAPTAILEYLQFLSTHRRALDYQDILDQKEQSVKSYAGKAGSNLEFEARSWLLTHYLLSSTENLGYLRTYSQLINQDIPSKQAFEKAFGYKVSKISYKLWEYQHKALKSILLDIKTLPSADISFSSLPKSANNLLLLDAAVRSCPDTNQGLRLLEKIRSEAINFPSSDFAKLILSRAQIAFGKPEESVEFLTKLTQNDPTLFDGFYLLGNAQLKLAERSNQKDQLALVESAQKNLVRALFLNPQSPEATFAYYKVGILRNEPSEAALGSAVLSMQMAGEVSNYTRASALAYAYLGRNNEALKLLNTMAHNARDTTMADWAKNWKDRIAKGVAQSDILNEMRVEPSPSATFKEWTIATEYVLKNAASEAATEDAQNIILNDQETQKNKQNQSAPTPGGPGMNR